jgi:hypothetical protein
MLSIRTTYRRMSVLVIPFLTLVVPVVQTPPVSAQAQPTSSTSQNRAPSGKKTSANKRTTIGKVKRDEKAPLPRSAGRPPENRHTQAGVTGNSRRTLRASGGNQLSAQKAGVRHTPPPPGFNGNKSQETKSTKKDQEKSPKS